MRRLSARRLSVRRPLCGNYQSGSAGWCRRWAEINSFWEVGDMPGLRQPTDVIKANGRKHLSRAEEAERRRREPKVNKAKTAKPPKWLPEQLKKDFRTLGKRLIAAGIYTDLDADTLGRYLVAQHQWLIATQ